MTGEPVKFAPGLALRDRTDDSWTGVVYAEHDPEREDRSHLRMAWTTRRGTSPISRAVEGTTVDLARWEVGRLVFPGDVPARLRAALAEWVYKDLEDVVPLLREVLDLLEPEPLPEAPLPPAPDHPYGRMIDGVLRGHLEREHGEPRRVASNRVLDARHRELHGEP